MGNCLIWDQWLSVLFADYSTLFSVIFTGFFFLSQKLKKINFWKNTHQFLISFFGHSWTFSLEWIKFFLIDILKSVQYLQVFDLNLPNEISRQLGETLAIAFLILSAIKHSKSSKEFDRFRFYVDQFFLGSLERDIGLI